MQRILTHQRVTELYDRCSAPRHRRMGVVEVEGIESRHTLLQQRLDESRNDIVALMAALPEGFRAPHTGWSVAKMIADSSGIIWTTDRRTIEKLCVLGIGAGLGRWCARRDQWPKLPGGLPYFVAVLPGELH